MGSVLIIALQSKLLRDHYQTKREKKQNNIFEPRAKKKTNKPRKSNGTYFELFDEIT